MIKYYLEKQDLHISNNTLKKVNNKRNELFE